MDWGDTLAICAGATLVIVLSAGLAVGAGTTTVAVQPGETTVGAGETTTVDIVVESASGGVGSLDLQLAVADGETASITDVAVAGTPETVQTTDGENSVRIAATGMDTDDTGSVTVATVTLSGDAGGTSALDLTVSAIGDESGSAYDLGETTDGELIVEGTAPNEGPSAVATTDQTRVTVGQSVQFDASGSSDTDGSIESYAWTFDDGTTTSGVTPTHAFSSPGTYTVELTVTDNDGATDTTTTTVEVVDGNAAPEASLSANSDSITVGESVQFDASGSSDPDGTVALYDWSFGDSSSDAGVQPAHTYSAAGTYTVRLTVTDDDGATDTATTTVEVTGPNDAPSAAATANRTRVGVDQPVQFDATNSTDSDSSIATYSWAFGDDTTADGPQPTHAFASPGTYTTEVTVTDDEGAIDTASITVEVGSSNEPPTAMAAANQTQVTVDEPVRFNASNASDSDGSVESYEWAFDDGTTASGVQATHSFASAGTYTVELTVTDDDGATDTATITVESDATPADDDDSEADDDDGGTSGGDSDDDDGGSDDDESGTSGGDSDDDDESDTGGSGAGGTGGSSASGSDGDTDTPQRTSTLTETPTATPIETETPTVTETQSPATTETRAETETSTPSTTEPASGLVAPLAGVGGLLIVAVAIRYYRRE